MKRSSPATEHYFIPVTLVLVNICLIHFLFALYAASSFSTAYVVCTGLALAGLLAGLLLKSRAGMLISGIFYLLLLGGLLNPLWA